MPKQSWLDLIDSAEKEGGGDFEPIPASEYDFVIVQADALTSSTNKDMFKIRAKVIGGPHAGRLVFHNFTISTESPKAMNIFFRQFGVLGLTKAEFFSTEPNPSQIASALLGRAFKGVVTVGTHNGKGKNDIKDFKTVSDEVKQAAKSVFESSGSSPQASSGVPSQAPPSPSAVPSAPAPAPAAPAPPPPAPAPAAPPPPAPPAPAVPAPAAPPATEAPAAPAIPPPPSF